MVKRPNEVGGLLESLDNYPDHLRLIGLIVTEMARAEGTLALTFWALIDDPARADGVFWTLGNAKARSDVVRGVAMETLHGSITKNLLKEEILAAIDAFRNAAGKRNDIAHGQWGTPAKKSADPFISIRRPATKNPIFQKIYSIADLEQIVAEIREAERWLSKINMVLDYHLRPGPHLHMDRIRAQFAGTDAYFRKFE